MQGHDTTSAALSWTIHLVGRDPEVQVRLLQMNNVKSFHDIELVLIISDDN